MTLIPSSKDSCAAALKHHTVGTPAFLFVSVYFQHHKLVLFVFSSLFLNAAQLKLWGITWPQPCCPRVHHSAAGWSSANGATNVHWCLGDAQMFTMSKGCAIYDSWSIKTCRALSVHPQVCELLQMTQVKATGLQAAVDCFELASLLSGSKCLLSRTLPRHLFLKRYSSCGNDEFDEERNEKQRTGEIDVI